MLRHNYDEDTQMKKYSSLIRKINLFEKLSQYKVARKVDDLAMLQANIGNYIHFSNSDRFGISYHKDIHPGNPRGVYGFPFTNEKYERIKTNKPSSFDDYGHSKYIYIFSVNGNILNMDNININDLSNKLREIVTRKYKKTSYNIIDNPTIKPYSVPGAEFLYWIGRIARELFKNEHSGVNVLLRDLGYDAIETRKYGFGDNIASEIAVLNPSSVNLIAKINNPMMNKEQIKEIDWYNSPEYAAEQKAKAIERDLASKRRLEEAQQRIKELESKYK